MKNISRKKKIFSLCADWLWSFLQFNIKLAILTNYIVTHNQSAFFFATRCKGGNIMIITVEIDEKEVNKIFEKHDEENEQLLAEAFNISDAEMNYIMQTAMGNLTQERKTDMKDLQAVIVGACTMYDYLLDKLEIE